MKNFSILIFIIFIHEIISLLVSYYRRNTNGGKRIEVFKNKSFLKKSLYIFLPVATIINIIIVLKFSGIINFAFFQFYIISKAFRIMKDICIYENGILCYGKFIKCQEMTSVKLVKNQGITIEMKRNYKRVILDKIEREKEMVGILKKIIKGDKI